MRHVYPIVAAAALVVTACGGGGGYEAPTPEPGNEVPSSATSSIANFVAYLDTLRASETSEPLVISNTTPPTSETAEPLAPT